MAKFVCDFEQVSACSKKLLSESEAMINVINNMDTSVDKNLAEWTGYTHDEFISSIENKKNDLLNYANVSIQLSEFLSTVSQAIMTLEEELASMTI